MLTGNGYIYINHCNLFSCSANRQYKYHILSRQGKHHRGKQPPSDESEGWLLQQIWAITCVNVFYWYPTIGQEALIENNEFCSIENLKEFWLKEPESIGYNIQYCSPHLTTSHLEIYSRAGQGWSQWNISCYAGNNFLWSDHRLTLRSEATIRMFVSQQKPTLHSGTTERIMMPDITHNY